MCPSLKNVDVSDCVSESTYVFVAASSERNSEINIHNTNAAQHVEAPQKLMHAMFEAFATSDK